MIRIFQDNEALSLGAAKLFADCAREAVEGKGTFCAALSGGHTPRRVYELLAQSPLRDRVDWGRTEIFWGDERCVPADDNRNNSKMAFENLLNHVPVPSQRIHPIHCDKQPEKSAARYERLLEKFFGGRPVRFDLIFLGLGENGHTASLFPETAVLKNHERLVSVVQVEGEDFCRVTLTPRAINDAAVVAFLVAGASKASIVREVILGRRDPYRLPAQLVQPLEGKILWLLDRKAASRLEGMEESGGMILNAKGI
jgi:6-phosphogluconolactonase